jgi:chemotaxis signal transduction protein
LQIDPVNIRLLEARATLHTKLQLFGQAINDYRMILMADPNNKKAGVQIEQLTTILRFRNTDIFESPNTTFDPWLE